MGMTLKEKVDRAYELDQLIKQSEKELDPLKKALKAHAKKHKKSLIEGDKASAVIAGSGRVTCDPEELQEALNDRDLGDNFYELVSVKNDPAKKLLGETAFDSISERHFNAYGKISLKPRKQ